jgi:hypothetical protein
VGTQIENGALIWKLLLELLLLSLESITRKKRKRRKERKPKIKLMMEKKMKLTSPHPLSYV